MHFGERLGGFGRALVPEKIGRNRSSNGTITSTEATSTAMSQTPFLKLKPLVLRALRAASDFLNCVQCTLVALCGLQRCLLRKLPAGKR